MKDTSKVTEAMIEAGKKCRLGVTTEKLIEAVLAATPEREPDYWIVDSGGFPYAEYRRLPDAIGMSRDLKETLNLCSTVHPVYIGEAI